MNDADPKKYHYQAKIYFDNGKEIEFQLLYKATYKEINKNIMDFSKGVASNIPFEFITTEGPLMVNSGKVESIRFKRINEAENEEKAK